MAHIDINKIMSQAQVADVHPVIIDASIEPDDSGFIVRTLWSGVDRSAGSGIVATNRKLADRLAAAIRAGAAVRSEGAFRDINGQIYVREAFAVRARTLNADLTRLGF